MSAANVLRPGAAVKSCPSGARWRAARRAAMIPGPPTPRPHTPDTRPIRPHDATDMKPRPFAVERALLLLLLAAACAREAAPDPAADRQAIAAVRAQFEAAENASDIEQVRAAFAEDIQMMAPNAPAAVGIDSAVARLQRTFDAGRLAIRYESEEIVAFGDWGFDRGTYRFTMTPASGAAASSQTGKYLWISQRQTDGTWKLSRVTWNGNGG